MTACGHLEHYTTHGISPVRYETGDLVAHFERRDSLYRTLGLPPVTFRGRDILEVAPGSGQNSLYFAYQNPKRLDLVEPNPHGADDIERLYAEHGARGALCRLHRTRFETFEAPSRYDIVVCENWLGHLAHERALLRKLAELVRPGGVLVLTVVPYAGFFSNVVRRAFALRLDDSDAPFAARTHRMLAAFGSHLTTIAGMTRRHADWIQDCMLNPHYLDVVLPFESVVDEIGASMEVLGTAPRFVTDWRWFKTMHGAGRAFNWTALDGAQANVHNLIDYRRTFPPRDPDANAELERLCRTLHQRVTDFDRAIREGSAHADRDIEPIAQVLGGLTRALATLDDALSEAVEEARSVWCRAPLDPTMVSNMTRFGGVFGRETQYVSFTRNSAAG